MKTKEEVESLLTKYGQAYKAGDSEAMKEIRAEAYKMAGIKVTEEKSKKDGGK